MNLKKLLSKILLVAMFATLSNIGIASAGAGSVVINEIAWMGSASSANDEWIELYNASAVTIDLAGWMLTDDGVTIHTFESESIEAGGYYLIEDNEDAVLNTTADLILDLSLANTGDSLELLDSAGVTVDSVNSAGGAWFAGNSTTKATMERVSSVVSGDEATNWATGADTGGTPRTLNTASATPSVTPTVELYISDSEPQQYDTVTITAHISNVSDLLAYEVDLEYADDFLEYQAGSSIKDIFLSENGAVSTVFQSGLENGVQGKLVLAEARLGEVSGVSGSGDLFSVEFIILGEGDSIGELAFGTDSFMSDGTVDLESIMANLQIDVQLILPSEVLNLQATPGTAQYSADLVWSAAESGADIYKILRKSALGVFEVIGTSTDLGFTDAQNLIPNHEYSYQIVTVIGPYESLANSATFTETRGIKGDNDRSNRVDGRDLMNLATNFALGINDSGFDPLADTTYDGLIDGSDLIDIGVNWAKTYSS